LVLRLTAAAAAAAAVGTRAGWLWRLLVVSARIMKQPGVVVDVDWEG